MTEEQARQRWCPFAASRAIKNRTDEGFDFLVNFTGPAPHETVSPLCLASDCMAWRWDVVVQTKASLSEGHCGLAGS